MFTWQDMDVTKMRPADHYDSPHSYSVRQQSRSGGSRGSEGTGSGGRRKGNLSFDPNVNIVMPEDITPAALRNVAERSGGKVYNAHIGTTCHQCRFVAVWMWSAREQVEGKLQCFMRERLFSVMVWKGIFEYSYV